jgi:hypothetical protein
MQALLMIVCEQMSVLDIDYLLLWKTIPLNTDRYRLLGALENYPISSIKCQARPLIGSAVKIALESMHLYMIILLY